MEAASMGRSPYAPPRHVGRRGRRVGGARAVRRRARRGGRRGDARPHPPAARRARVGAGVRAGGAGAGGGEARRAQRRGRPVRRGRRDDGDRGGARRRARPDERDDLRAGPGRHRRARCVIRRRSLPRGADVRARSRARVREIRRVLRPGGRVALAVWGPRDRNPWLGVVFDAVSAQIGAPVPPPGVPGRSRSQTPTRWPACSRPPAWRMWSSASGRCRCAPTHSTSGGSGRPRSPGR